MSQEFRDLLFHVVGSLEYGGLPSEFFGNEGVIEERSGAGIRDPGRGRAKRLGQSPGEARGEGGAERYAPSSQRDRKVNGGSPCGLYNMPDQ